MFTNNAMTEARAEHISPNSVKLFPSAYLIFRFFFLLALEKWQGLMEFLIVTADFFTLFFEWNFLNII